MITVDLGNLKDGIVGGEIIIWLYNTFGPSGDRWKLIGLAYVEFRKDRDATLFLTAWG